MRLLLISNSTNAGEAYLAHPLDQIRTFLGKGPVRALFFPYAAVTFSFDEYAEKVRSRFEEIGHELISIHETEQPLEAIEQAEAIVVGGGNTFHLLKLMQDGGMLKPVRTRVMAGTPYIGWSAGSNLCCPSIRTTNDMPILEPDNFKALNLIPFQINPHYLDANPDGHAGETREMRINEFIEVNPGTFVVGLREGTMLRYEKGHLELIGPLPARLFRKGIDPEEIQPGSNCSFLL